MALYPYTLQPVELNISEDEFHQAQYELFEQTNPGFSLKSIKTKEWAIMAVTVIAAIAGLIFVKGYSTIIFWLMLALVVIYLLIRTLGMQWYIKREFEKQIADQEMPTEMRDMKLGVQKHGLIMSMPAPNAGVQPNVSKAMRGMQMRSANTQQATIPWSAIKSWDETNDFIFMMFEIQGQKGSQIIPKRLEQRKFPIETIRTHLKEVVPIQGIRPDSIAQ